MIYRCNDLINARDIKFSEILTSAHLIIDALEQIAMHLEKNPGNCKALLKHSDLNPRYVAKIYKVLYQHTLHESVKEMSRYITLYYSMLDTSIKHFPRSDSKCRCIQNFAAVNLSPTFLTQDEYKRTIYFPSCD